MSGLGLMADHSSSVLALGAFGFVYLVQLVIADLAAVRAKHEPGTPVQGGHEDFLFRATRAHANTGESVSILLLLALFALLAGGDAAWTGRVLWSLVLLRVLHAAFYYLDFRLLRGAAFLLSLVALAALFVIGVAAFRAAS